jgi:hypothetical protein
MQLYKHFNGLSDDKLHDFTFLRFDRDYPSVDVHTFLLDELYKGGLINDHELSKILLSVNLSLFGNVGIPSECTWEYFMKSREHTQPTKAVYELIMDRFSFKHTFIKELMALSTIYQTKEQMIVQVFVPKDRINDIGYVSWIRGIPADETIMDFIFDSIKKKKFPKTREAIIALTDTLKKEKDQNPIFRNLTFRVENDDFNLSQFLDIYCNHPEAIPTINSVMGRLIFTSELLLNPYSGVKIFRYSTATSKQLAAYHKKLDLIIKKMIFL